MALTGSAIDGNDLIIGSVGLDKLDSTQALPNQVLTVNAVGILEYASVDIEDISGIDGTGANIGDALVWNGTSWVPGSAGTSTGGATVLDELLDVATVAPLANQTLKYDDVSGLWANGSIDYSELTGTPVLVTTIDGLTDTTILTPAIGQTLIFNGTAWVNQSLTKSSITDFSDADYATAAQGALASTATQTGANVSVFTNDIGYLTALTAPLALGLSTVATTGDYSSLINIPAAFTPSAHTHTKIDITDFSDADYATAAQGALATSALQAGANISTLANDAGYFSNVTEAASIAGQSLVYTGTTWTNQSLTKSSITDFSEGDYATAAQGVLASTATQPGANISSFTNDAGHLTNSAVSIPLSNQALIYNGVSWANQALTKTLITDFNEGDYATSAQGTKADSALQPFAPVSSLANDAGYLTGAITLNTLNDVSTVGATAGQVLKYTGTTWVADNDSSGEVNTASNIGTGQQIFSSKVASDLQFKSITAGTNISVTSTPSELIINSTALGEINTASSVGAGHGLVAGKVASDLQFKSVVAGANVVLNSTITDITLSVPSLDWTALTGVPTTFTPVAHTHTKIDITDFSDADYATAAQGTLATTALQPGTPVSSLVNDAGYLTVGSGINDLIDVNTAGLAAGNVLKYNGTTWLPANDTSDGEANTASNIGPGAGIYANKLGSDLQFKTITAGNDITITSDADEIIITGTPGGEINTASNLGLGAAIYAGKTTDNLSFRSLIAGNNVILTSSATSITIDASSIVLLSELTDTTILAPVASHTLIHDGVTWTNQLLTKATITDFNEGDYATAAQGAAAGTALQPLAPVSALTNDIGYLTGGSGINDLLDVNTAGLAAGQVLKYNGAEWLPSSDGTGEVNHGASLAGTGEEVYAGMAGTDLQFRRIKSGAGISVSADATGIIITSSATSGETNTASNIGSGVGTFSAKSGTDLQFKSITAGQNISITSTTSDITISAVAGATSLDGLSDVTLVNPASLEILINDGAKFVNQVMTKSLISDFSDADYATAAQGAAAGTALQPLDNISELLNNHGYLDGGSVLNDFIDVVVPAPTEGQILRYVAGAWINTDDTGQNATGEINTVSNLTGDQGLFAAKVSSDLQFKSLTAGPGISLSSDGTQITIESTASGIGEVNTASDTAGTGEGITAGKTGSDLQFKRINAGTNITVTSDANEITINSTAVAAPASALTGLTDTDGVAVGNRFLRWDSNGTFVNYVSISTNDITDFNGGDYATAAQGALADTALQDINTLTISELSNVDTTGATTNSILKYNGTTWVVGSDNLGIATSSMAALTDTTISGTQLTNDILQWNGTSWIDVNLTAAGIEQSGTAASLLTSYSTTATSSTLYAPMTHGSHVPAVAVTTDDGKVLTAGTGPGLFTWETPTVSAATATNLAYITSVTTGTVTSSTGIDAIIPAATTTIAGLMTAAIKTTFDAIPTTYESALNNPAIDGYVLSSTALGVRSWIAPAAGGTGEVNTISNLANGVGAEGIYFTKVGTDFKLKSLRAGTGVTLSSDGSEITIAAASLADTNDYVTSGVFNGVTGDLTLTRTDTGTVAINLPITTTKVANWDLAYTHSIAAHAPSDANNYVHPTTDGSLHVPANGTLNAGKVLTAGSSAGLYTWQDAAAATNLTYAASPAGGTIISDAGTNAVIPLTDGVNAGLMTPAEQAAIAANSAKASNVTTDLTYTTAANSGTVNSSDGQNATIPAATISLAGLMTSADKTKLDGLGGATASPLTTKGDLYTYGTADTRLPVGTDGQVLTADTASAEGVKWATPAAGGASSTVTETVILLQNSASQIDAIHADTATLAPNVTITLPSNTGNLTTFTFTGYKYPPISIKIYAQDADLSASKWFVYDIADMNATAKTEIVDPNGTTLTPDLTNGAVDIPPITLSLSQLDTGARGRTDGFNPYINAQVVVQFLMQA